MIGVGGEEDADAWCRECSGSVELVEIDGATVLGHDAAAYPKAETRAAFPLGGEEGLEEVAEDLLGDAGAGDRRW